MVQWWSGWCEGRGLETAATARRLLGAFFSLCCLRRLGWGWGVDDVQRTRYSLSGCPSSECRNPCTSALPSTNGYNAAWLADALHVVSSARTSYRILVVLRAAPLHRHRVKRDSSTERLD